MAVVGGFAVSDDSFEPGRGEIAVDAAACGDLGAPLDRAAEVAVGGGEEEAAWHVVAI